MPPSQFYVRLQHGITGGFAPPTPSAIYTLTRSDGSPEIDVASAVRPSGEASLSQAISKRLNVDSHSALIEELHSILKGLPTRSEDIYGLDIGIAWGSDDLEWSNEGPEGCGGGTEAQASEEDKKKFRRAVEIIGELVGKEN